MNKREIAGLFILLGTTQFIIIFKISEFLYPGYSVANNYISDLGVGNTALLFNSSMIVLGILGIIAAFLLFEWDKVFSILFLLSSIGALGVGVFPENMGIIHSISALITFLFSGVASVYSIKLDKHISRFIWCILGIMSLISLGLYINHRYLGLGVGGMERMIVYPVLIWLIGFSINIIHSEEEFEI